MSFYQRTTICVTAPLALAACAEPSPERATLTEAHEAVRRSLKDPDSAKFEDEAALVFPGQGLVCMGKVNAKNGFGGYTGFQGYTYSRGVGVFMDGDPSPGTLTVLQECTKAISDRADYAVRQTTGATP